MDQFTGGCLCGKVRIIATGRPYRVGPCHCLDCRNNGALFHASAIFPDTAVTITSETPDFAGQHFCPTCGSSVFGRNGDEIEVNKVLEGRPHVVDAIKNGEIHLVLNTTETASSESDSKSIRQTAVMQKVPYYTTLPGILSATKAIAAQRADTISVRPLQDYFKK